MAKSKVQGEKSNKPSKSKKISINTLIQNEISRLSEQRGINAEVLEEFAQFVIVNYKKQGKQSQGSTAKSTKVQKAKPLTLGQLKAAVFQHFAVKNLTELRKSGTFQMATNGLGKLELKKKEDWQILYRKFIGILAEEEQETGYGCINGLNIFKYDMPWRTFGLDPKTASTDEVKSAYRELSKIYHPDNRETGDAAIFDRLTVFYKSLTEKF